MLVNVDMVLKLVIKIDVSAEMDLSSYLAKDVLRVSATIKIDCYHQIKVWIDKQF